MQTLYLASFPSPAITGIAIAAKARLHLTNVRERNVWYCNLSEHETH